MTTRRRDYKGFNIPSASRTRIEKCPDPACGHLHLIGLDEQDVPFCEIVVDQAIITDIVAKFPYGAKA